MSLNHLQQLINDIKKQYHWFTTAQQRSTQQIKKLSSQIQNIIKAYRNIKNGLVNIVKHNTQNKNQINTNINNNQKTNHYPIIIHILMQHSINLLILFMHATNIKNNNRISKLQNQISNLQQNNHNYTSSQIKILRQTSKQYFIIDQDQILQLPLQHISNHFVQAIKNYQNRLIMNKIQYKDNFFNFYSWYQKIIKDFQSGRFNDKNYMIKSIILQQNDQESYQNDDFKYVYNDEEIRKTLILQQYQLLKKGNNKQQQINQYKIASKYCYRLLLFKQIKKSVKKAQYNIKQRQLRLKQLLQNQRKYIDKLNSYIVSVKQQIEDLKPIQNQKKSKQQLEQQSQMDLSHKALIDKGIIKKIFSNIQTIKNFHSQLFSQLQQHFAHYQKYQMYAPVFKKFIPFFKLYIQYIYSMNDGAQQLFLKLQSQNPQVKEICKKFYNTYNVKASDAMMQPIYKISKYQLFFGDIIKHTNSAHPDKQQMKQVLQKFQITLSAVNNSINKIMGHNKIHQLQHELGTEKNSIIVEGRVFLDEYLSLQLTQLILNETGSRQNIKTKIRLIIFNDVKLFINLNSKDIIKRLSYDYNFQIIRNQNQNEIQILYNPKLIIKCNSYQQCTNLYETFKQIQRNNIKNYLALRFKSQIQWFKKFKIQVLSDINHNGYPIKVLIDVLQKMEKACNKRRQHKFQVFSDIFFWNGPQLLMALIGFKKYILDHSSTIQKQNDSVNLSSLKMLEQKRQQKIMNFIDVLNIPINFICKKIIEIIQIFKKKVQTVSKINNVQRQSLQKFIKWYQKSIQEINKSTQLCSISLKKIILSQYQPLNNKALNKHLKVIYMIFFFMAKLRVRAKKAQLTIQQKRLAIKQLFQTQQSYILKLNNYINEVKKPIQNTLQIKQQTCKKIFSTVVQIRNFHQEFIKDISDNFYKFHKYQMYGDMVKKYLPFFRLYSQYIYNANNGSSEVLRQLQQTNIKVNRICNDFYLKNKMKAPQVLSQPTFRIVKYPFIFQKMIKNTNPHHPDYQKLKQCLQMNKQIILGVNKQVDKMICQDKLYKLDFKYGTKQKPIIQKNRELIKQYNVFIINQNQLRKVILYILNDMLIIVDFYSKKLIKKIQVDYKFFVRKQQDNMINKNLIKIHSDGFIHISTGKQSEKAITREQVFAQLQKISKQGEHIQSLVEVNILGTQSVASTSIGKHTKYILQFSFKGFKRRAYLRFSDMYKIINEIQLEYHDNLGIQNSQNLQKSFLNNYKEQIIQKRKTNIEQILQKIINHQKVRKNPAMLLQSLGLNSNFFDNAEKSYQKSMQLLTADKAANASFTKNQLNNSLTLLCAAQIKLGKNIFFDIQQNKDIGKKLKEENKIKLKIKIYNKDESVIVLINQNSRADQVLDKVSKLIGLKNNRDFRIFHQVGKKQSRVLDPQQQIFKMFKNQLSQNRQQNQNKKFISSMVKSVFSKEQKFPSLSLKKYIYLPFEIQQKQFSSDLVRLKLLVYQTFEEIKDIKYHISFDEYLLYLAMYIYIENQGNLEAKVNEKIIHKVLPFQLFKIKNYTQKQLLQKTITYQTELSSSVSQIIKKNKTSINQGKIKIQNTSVYSLYTTRHLICCRIFLAKISKNQTFGSNLFYVQLQKQTYQKIQQKSDQIAYNMWLSLKLNSISLLTPSTKQKIKQQRVEDIQKIIVYSEAIVIKMSQQGYSQHKQYRLNTYQSYIISQLFKYNQALYYVLNQLKNDSELIYKTKLYKEQLLQE